jgi:hypothetical protein
MIGTPPPLNVEGGAPPSAGNAASALNSVSASSFIVQIRSVVEKRLRMLGKAP